MGRLVTLIGNVATGKTTISKMLSKSLAAYHIPADELYKINPIFPLALKDRKRWSLTSDLWFLEERVKMAREIPQYLERSDVVVDSGLPMSWVYAHSRLDHGYFTGEEWNLYQTYYQELTQELPESDAIIYLKAPAAFLRKRVVERGRDFEVTYHSEQYLQGLADSLEALVDWYTNEKKQQVVTIDVAEVDFTHTPDSLDTLLADCGLVEEQA